MMVMVLTAIDTQAMAEEPPQWPSYSVNLTLAELTFEVGATVGVEFVIAAVALSVVVFEIGAVVGLAVVAVEVGIMVVGNILFFSSFVPSTLQIIYPKGVHIGKIKYIINIPFGTTVQSVIRGCFFTSKCEISLPKNSSAKLAIILDKSLTEGMGIPGSRTVLPTTRFSPQHIDAHQHDKSNNP